MSKNQVKHTQPVVRSREAMESLVAEITALKNNQRLLTAQMDSQIQNIRQFYEPQLASQSQSLEEKIELARSWAEANPDQFGTARSIEMVHGVVGWRLGQPALKTLAGWTWDRVKDALKAIGASAYIRTKEEVNKQNLLADRDVVGAGKLRQIGLRIAQEESFFVEPKLTAVEWERQKDA
jgi:phage host-nuclease inhibitor protein Gam